MCAGRYTKEDCLNLNKTNIWCSEGRCLSSDFRCNGFAECVLKEDGKNFAFKKLFSNNYIIIKSRFIFFKFFKEQNCDFKPCEADQFQCASGGCIEKSKRCDSIINCPDRSDEFNCEEFKCDSNQFKCHSGQCIGIDKKCNFYVDCPDWSDEDRLLCGKFDLIFKIF